MANPPTVTFAILAIILIGIPLAAMAIRPQIKRRTKIRAAKNLLERHSADIGRIHAQIIELEAFDSGYLMKKDWDALLSYASPVLEAFSGISDKTIEKLAVATEHDKASTPKHLSDVEQTHPDGRQTARELDAIRKRCTNESYRDQRNGEFKKHELELCDNLFSDIDGGKSLDQQQRDAIITDEYSNLVIAGAGSGKTSVVVGKVKYLVERWNIDPSEILVTSFTRASVNDLRTRIEASGIHGVATRTFHSLGLRALGSDIGVANENALTRCINSYLSKELPKHPEQSSAFLEFFGLWGMTAHVDLTSRDAETRMKLLKAQDMRTLKGYVQESSHQTDMETIRGERVKSLEELMIANFLFLNGVEYEYEAPYTHDIPSELGGLKRRAYQPDFFLTEYGIWFEHFGIDENGRVPWLKTRVEEQAYIDGMKWKMQVHRACGTRLIASYSYWNKDQNLLNKVEQLLVKNGVELNLNPERNAEIYGRLIRDRRFFSSMSQLLATFISLVKANNTQEAEVDDKARAFYKGNGAMWHRYDLFTRFAWPIMHEYQKSLTQGARALVDFDDMINRASAKIREKGCDETYRYIIVDEYQDISLSRFELLSAIRDATGAKLMCVGDDWQAIYRFAGSDVTLFTSFSRLVGYHATKRIERTYRNSQKLVDAASAFILKNPDQLRKTVTSMAPNPSKPPISIISHSEQQTAFTYALGDLLSSPDGGGEIKVLGRNRYDLKKIFPGLEPSGNYSFRKPKHGNPAEEKFDDIIVYTPPNGNPVEMGYMTVHKSKGLQADNVIVIGLTNERHGFPNMAAEDPILELLLADSDRYDFAEERRLFYVALTRTKNRVWLVTTDDTSYPGISSFVDEIRTGDHMGAVAFYCQSGTEIHTEDAPTTVSKQVREPAVCPRCGGPLVVRRGTKGTFVGCNNYPFCTKTYNDIGILSDRVRCPECGGWMIRRRGRDGREFFGCTNYPKYCKHTISIEFASDGLSKPSSPSRKAPSYHPSSRPRAFKMSPARSDRKKPYLTTQSITKSKRWSTTPRCPKCNKPMVLRSGPYGQFYGCVDYPACKGKRNAGGSKV